jgi:hypothetical protein
MITLKSGQFGWDFLIANNQDDRTVYIQSDADYEGVAASFGWNSEDYEPHEFQSALDYLSEIVNDDNWHEDPGYFTEPVL